MIDSHSHIDGEAFNEDRADMLQRAWDAGVTAIIVPDIRPPLRNHLIDVVNSDERLFRGIGIHPHHVGEVTEADLREVEERCEDAKVVAIGEIGLDYYYDFCPPDVQKSYFRAQIGIAKRHGLPVIVHNRDSDDDVLNILREEQDGTLRGVLHCFSSSDEVLERALEIGLHVSFTGNITFKKSTLDSVVRSVPLDRFMIETDAPYITPVPHRGKRNEPSYVRFVAERIAEIRNMTVEQVIDTTTRTARTFFGLLSVFLVAVAIGNAQPTPPKDEDYENDRDWEIALDNFIADSIAYEKWIKPRKLGFGISLGSNTTVEQQKYLQRYDPSYGLLKPNTDPARWTTYERDSENQPERSFSFEGLFTFGATFTYGVATPLVLELTYLYTENTKPAQEFGLDPITTNIIEFAAIYSLNPYSKINFMPELGATYAHTDDGTSTTTKFGINFGAGIGVNIPTPIGLFYPMVNVRFNYMLGTDEARVIRRYVDAVTGEQWVNSANPNQISEDIADVITLYSIPRLTILYYFNL